MGNMIDKQIKKEEMKLDFWRCCLEKLDETESFNLEIPERFSRLYNENEENVLIQQIDRVWIKKEIAYFREGLKVLYAVKTSEDEYYSKCSF